MLLLGFINFVISLILVFITIIIYSPTNKYKLVKSKEDQLFLQKTLITTIFFFTDFAYKCNLYIANGWENFFLLYGTIFI